MSDTSRSLPRTRMYYIIYVAIFGVIWGLGTSVLAAALPPELTVRALVINWFEVIILCLTKLVVRKPLSVTIAIGIAATISVFTFSFGPPNPYKPAFMLAGLAFDAGTLFRTKDLRLWNLLVGFVCFVLAISAIFVGIIWYINPSAFQLVLYTVPVAMAVYFVEGLIVFPVLWHYIQPNRAPPRVVEIWRQLGVVEVDD
jgi:drug/metabolite transporter (DMT)-like permease